MRLVVRGGILAWPCAPLAKRRLGVVGTILPNHGQAAYRTLISTPSYMLPFVEELCAS
jgi:hypothetical protein